MFKKIKHVILWGKCDQLFFSRKLVNAQRLWLDRRIYSDVRICCLNIEFQSRNLFTCLHCLNFCFHFDCFSAKKVAEWKRLEWKSRKKTTQLIFILKVIMQFCHFSSAYSGFVILMQIFDACANACLQKNSNKIQFRCKNSFKKQKKFLIVFSAVPTSLSIFSNLSAFNTTLFVYWKRIQREKNLRMMHRNLGDSCFLVDFFYPIWKTNFLRRSTKCKSHFFFSMFSLFNQKYNILFASECI